MFSFLSFIHFPNLHILTEGLLHSSVGKEFACNARDPGLIPGSGRSTGEGIGYPLQYSWASLVVQLVKNLPAMWETWVRSLGWEDPLEKGKATHSSILASRILWTIQSMGLQRVGYNWVIFTFSHIGLVIGFRMGQPTSRESTRHLNRFPLPLAFQGSSSTDGPPGEIGNVGPQVGMAACGVHFICFCGGER